MWFWTYMMWAYANLYVNEGKGFGNGDVLSLRLGSICWKSNIFIYLVEKFSDKFERSEMNISIAGSQI